MPELPETRRDASARVLDQMSSLSRRSRTFATMVAHRADLQPAQVQVLFSLYRATECRVAALADQQLVDPSVASRQITALVKDGLLARRPDPADGRAALVSLTDAGLAKVKQVRALHVQAVAESLRDWPVERMDRLAADLEELVGAAEQAYERFTGAEPAMELVKELV
ncbi:MarR family winged helix-turn-helix transcriptional regulator [Georgenia sp. SYP-B2076]|uniref:MarR family winged helix-turn-helix transcriptional regulator n=1 Tax=Georgenia sp. SYP-B2076 TaxID=2495881 RepID=UPI0013E0896D|nr:MarR family transcriptional regulator [Georgenia sp. SYP-B2076]